jgi:shikimate dehydrogenase
MSESDAKKIYGLIGYPVRHSLSPVMHNAAFKSFGINAEYRLFEIKPQDLEQFFESQAPATDTEGISYAKSALKGLNVTVPHKGEVLDYVSLRSDAQYLRKVEAVNTLFSEDGIWKACNTDILGFSRDVREQIDPSGKRAAVLGAGGAARAVSYGLVSMGAASIDVYDIDSGRSDHLIEIIKSIFPQFNMRAARDAEGLDLKNKDILINATPVGLKEEDPHLIDGELLHEKLFVYDLIYNP